jgi:hypothetical protein
MTLIITVLPLNATNYLTKKIRIARLAIQATATGGIFVHSYTWKANEELQKGILTPPMLKMMRFDFTNCFFQSQNEENCNLHFTAGSNFCRQSRAYYRR